jgi:hypothetical protein
MAYDSTLVVYTGIPLTTINVTAGMNLQTALDNINTAVATVIVTDYSSFNYGPYYGYTLKTPLGASITTITGFVEGTASGIGKVSSDLATFTGTTYPSDQSIISSAISNLQVPGITYSNSAGGLSISIGNTDSINTVLTKLATGLGDTGNLLAAPGNAWSLISITPDPTNIYDAFNELINYNITQNSVIAGKEASIGTFDNSINCLVTVGGTSTDTAGETIDLLTLYACTLPKFDASVITTTCLTPQGNLENWIQQLVNIADFNAANGFSAVDSSMTATSSGACSGFTIGVDPTWTGLSKVATSSQDTTPGTLTDKLIAGTNVTFTSSAPGNQTLTIDVTLPTPNQVATVALDNNPNYLYSKLLGGLDSTWGLAIIPQLSQDYSTLAMVPNMQNPFNFVQNLINYISTDPTLLAAFCALKTQCDGCQCLAATAFTVTVDLINTEFDLSWAAGTSLGETQTVAYRESGATNWITSANITLANPQLYTATSAVVANLNVNTVYEFQIVSNCGTGPNYSAIVTGIIYAQQTLTDGENGGVISVNQASMPTVDVIEYILLDSVFAPIENVNATGINPVAVFQPQLAGTYYVQYRYGTLINGVTLYSDDVSQAGTWYQSAGIPII